MSASDRPGTFARLMARRFACLSSPEAIQADSPCSNWRLQLCSVVAKCVLLSRQRFVVLLYICREVTSQRMCGAGRLSDDQLAVVFSSAAGQPTETGTGAGIQSCPTATRPRTPTRKAGELTGNAPTSGPAESDVRNGSNQSSGRETPALIVGLSRTGRTSNAEFCSVESRTKCGLANRSCRSQSSGRGVLRKAKPRP